MGQNYSYSFFFESRWYIGFLCFQFCSVQKFIAYCFNGLTIFQYFYYFHIAQDLWRCRILAHSLNSCCNCQWVGDFFDFFEFFSIMGFMIKYLLFLFLLFLFIHTLIELFLPSIAKKMDDFFHYLQNEFNFQFAN